MTAIAILVAFLAGAMAGVAVLLRAGMAIEDSGKPLAWCGPHGEHVPGGRQPGGKRRGPCAAVRTPHHQFAVPRSRGPHPCRVAAVRIAA